MSCCWEVRLVLESVDKLDSEATVFVHKMPDVVHFRTEKLTSTLKCSRKISVNFREFTGLLTRVALDIRYCAHFVLASSPISPNLEFSRII